MSFCFSLALSHTHTLEYLILVLDRHRERAEQVVCKLRIGKLEVALVVELEKGRRVGVLLLQVQVVYFRFVGRVAALLAYVHLRAPLLVRILVLNAVHLQAVRLQRAPLGERLLAQIALVRPDAGVRPGVPLQVERIVESLAAEGAQVALDVRVALHVPIQQPLQGERLLAYPADELVLLTTGGATALVLHLEHIRLLQQFGMVFVFVPQPAGDVLDGQWILDAVATVDELQLHFCRQAEILDG